MIIVEINRDIYDLINLISLNFIFFVLSMGALYFYILAMEDLIHMINPNYVIYHRICNFC